eukprot:40084_1
MALRALVALVVLMYLCHSSMNQTTNGEIIFLYRSPIIKPYIKAMTVIGTLIAFMIIMILTNLYHSSMNRIINGDIILLDRCPNIKPCLKANAMNIIEALIDIHRSVSKRCVVIKPEAEITLNNTAPFAIKKASIISSLSDFIYIDSSWLYVPHEALDVVLDVVMP